MATERITWETNEAVRRGQIVKCGRCGKPTGLLVNADGAYRTDCCASPTVQKK